VGSGNWEVGRKEERRTNAIVNRQAHPDALAARIREYQTNCIPSQRVEKEPGQPPEAEPPSAVRLSKRHIS
jgi:hypothetical protein